VDAARTAAAQIRQATGSYGDASGVDSNRIDRERIAVELMETLADRADQLSQDANGLANLLGRASDRLAPAASAAPAPPAVEPAAAEQPGSLARQVTERFDKPTRRTGGRFQARPQPAAQPRASGPPQDVSAGLRLLATQMAVAGSSREEIEARLRSEFGVVDTNSVLAEVFSPAEGDRS
jgi:hypothetical protein